MRQHIFGISQLLPRINLHLNPCRYAARGTFESITAVRRRRFGLFVVNVIGVRGQPVQFHLEWHTAVRRRAILFLREVRRAHDA